jgi:dimethylamine monooxygenase subunit C
MLVQGIKSRPVYGKITLDPSARRHIVALEGEGALALTEQCGSAELARTEVLYVAGGSVPKNHDKALAAIKPFDLWTAPTVLVLVNRLKTMLATAKMGTRLYLSGTEGFIGQTMQVALDAGMDFNSIFKEHRGSEARRVQCVHCKGITESVTTQPYKCSHCGLSLLVRDHYSRRLAAFQGVCIDAEDPGTAPAPEETFT